MSDRDDGDYGTGDFASSVRVTDEPTDTDEIRGDIERTRAEMGETIDAIQERLTGDSSAPMGGPGELAKEVATHVATEVRGEVTAAIQQATQQAKSAVRDATIGRAETAVSSAGETMKGTGTTMMDRIKQNPVPAAIAAAGIGWLYFGGGGQKGSDQQVTYRSGYGSGYGPSGYQGGAQGGYGQGDNGQGIAAQAKQTAGQFVGQTGEKASNLAGGVQETAGQVAGATQEKAQSMGGGVQRFLQESPLAAGLIAAGLGMAAGMAIPSTQKEDQLMGSARDSVVGQAQEKVGETVDKVQQVASEATQVVKEQAQEQGLAG